MNAKHYNKSGLTLLELLISLSILASVGVLVTSVFVNIKNIETKSIVKKEIQEEVRNLMERMVQDIRNHSIDFRGYYVLNGPHVLLGENTRDDSNLSYMNLPTTFPSGGDVLNPAPAFFDIDKRENILILLSNDGKSRIKYMIADPDGGGSKPNALMISKQTYSNFGTCHDLPELAYDSSHSWNTSVDDPDYCWQLDSDYPINPNFGYLPISSPETNISELEFSFNVHKSPFKVYEEDKVQYQPMITIKLTGRLANESSVIGNVPELTIQTTVTSRNYIEPDWSTN